MGWVRESNSVIVNRSSKWDSSKGLVIMGGDGASTTTEILTDDLTSDPYFDITATR